MSAPELPEELAGHLAALMDKSDAYAKARAATAIASGKAHLAASGTGPRHKSIRGYFFV